MGTNTCVICAIFYWSGSSDIWRVLNLNTFVIQFLLILLHPHFCLLRSSSWQYPPTPCYITATALFSRSYLAAQPPGPPGGQPRPKARQLGGAFHDYDVMGWLQSGSEGQIDNGQSWLQMVGNKRYFLKGQTIKLEGPLGLWSNPDGAHSVRSCAFMDQPANGLTW